MKKVLVIIAFIGVFTMQAQVSFKPGIRGGVNVSHFTKGDNDELFDDGTDYRHFSPKTDLYLGVCFTIRTTKYYTIQPEINYTRQGSDFEDRENLTNERLDISYLSLGAANKFTFTEKFNVHLGASFDFQVDSNFKTDSDFDLAFFLGAGYNFTKNFGVEARAKKGLIPVLDYSNGNHTNVVFSFGATYWFDLK